MDDDAQTFTWDHSKSADCLQRRGFGFGFAARVFDGPVAERTDGRRDYGEVRTQAMGRIEGQLFVVVYTQRGTTKHIVSARRAHEKELRKWQK